MSTARQQKLIEQKKTLERRVAARGKRVLLLILSFKWVLWRGSSTALGWVS